MGTDAREMETDVHTKPVHERSEQLYPVSQNENQLKCPSTGKWLETVKYPNHEILLCNKKEQTIDAHDNLDGSEGRYTE